MRLIMVGCLVLFTGMAYVSNEAQAQSPAGGDAQFTKLADQYFDQYYFPFNPTQGTLDGFHQYDSQLENYSRVSIERQVAVLKSFEQQVEQVDAVKLSLEQSADRQLVLDPGIGTAPAQIPPHPLGILLFRNRPQRAPRQTKPAEVPVARPDD